MAGRRLSSTRLLLFVSTALMLLAAPAQAGGLYTNEFSTTSQGNSGAGRGAWAPDASATLHNPATMTELDDHAFSGGFSLASGSISFDPASTSPSGDRSGGNQAGIAPIASANYVHRLSERLRFGFSFFSISGSILDPDNDWAGRFQMSKIALLTISMSPTLAIEVTDWLSIGGGPIATYGVLNWDLRFDVGGTERLVQLDDFDDWRAAGRVGILLKPCDSLSLAAYWNSKTDFELNGRLRSPAGLNPSVNVDLPLAQFVEVSAAWQVTEKTALLALFNWEDWSEADDLSISAAGQTVGASTGFVDTYKVAVGINHQLRDAWLLQFGVSFDTSALKNRDRTTALPVDQQTRVSFGFQYDWSESLVLGGSFVYGNFGDGEVRSGSVVGDYKNNDVFVLGLTLNYASLPWGGRGSF